MHSQIASREIISGFMDLPFLCGKDAVVERR
jgi:hypothetical protein